MSTVSEAPEERRFQFPTAFTILFGLIVLVAALTWIIPAGQYDRVQNAALNKQVPVAGTYAVAEPAPQGIVDIIMAPIRGFYDPAAGTANAIDVALFVLVIGGFIGVVTSTGAINAGIERAMAKLKGREKWMIPFLMALFAFGGTTYEAESGLTASEMRSSADLSVDAASVSFSPRAASAKVRGSNFIWFF